MNRALAALCSMISIASVASAEWPQFRGPNGAGIAEKGNPPTEFGPNKNVLWKTPLPEGHSSPIVSRDRIFVTAFDKSERKLETIAIDKASGKIAWRNSVVPKDMEPAHAINSPASTSVVTDGKRVYSYFGSYGLVAYEWDGKPAWESPLPVSKAVFGSGGSPVLAGDLLLVNRDYNPKPELLAFSKSDGKPVWTASLPPSNQGGPKTSHATPAVWKDEVLLHRPGELSAHSLKDGARRWWVQLGSSGCSTPLVAGDVVYVNAFGASTDTFEPVAMPPFAELVKKFDQNGDGKINNTEFPPDFNVLRRPNIPLNLPAHFPARTFFGLIDANGDGGVDESELAGIGERFKMMMGKSHGVIAIKPGGEGDLTGSAVLWREQKSVPEVPAPLAYQGKLYTVVNGGIFSCLDGATGKVLYRERLGAPGPYYSAPIAASGRIYTSSGEGVVTVLKAGDTLTVLSRNDLGEPVLATPAPVGDVLYVRSAGHLWAFGSKGK